MANHQLKNEAGFSLLELLIAMTVTLAVMVAASTLLASSLRTRARENLRSQALAAAQRALSIMSREISNSGYGLTDNGIVVADSAADSIRVRANLNNDSDVDDVDEDVRFILQTANNEIVRYDDSTATSARSVLATNISSLTIRYLNTSGTAVGIASAERVSIEVLVNLPAGPEEPAGTVRLLSQVALRNAPTTLQQF
ncbi:MAG TPA: prepilin-type N-terminal cleavage/methylation domain-containing protein [Pyrinomonadaceae bacterium]|jgi:type II secretory pathway pseudopilin PulG